MNKKKKVLSVKEYNEDIYYQDVYKDLDETEIISSPEFHEVNKNSGDTIMQDLCMENKDIFNLAPNPYPSIFKTFKQDSDSAENIFSIMTDKAMLESKMLKTQMALNEELITAEVMEREEKEKQTANYEKLWGKLKESIKANEDKDAEISKLKLSINSLKKNICALYKTAKDEVDRKDILLQRANSDIDYFKAKRFGSEDLKLMEENLIKTQEKLKLAEKNLKEKSTASLRIEDSQGNSTENFKDYSKETKSSHSGNKKERKRDYSSTSNKRKRESPIKKRNYRGRSYYSPKRNIPEHKHKDSPRKKLKAEVIKKTSYSKRYEERKKASHGVDTKKLLISDSKMKKVSKENVISNETVRDNFSNGKTVLQDSGYDKSDCSTVQKPLQICETSLEDDVSNKPLKTTPKSLQICETSLENVASNKPLETTPKLLQLCETNLEDDVSNRANYCVKNIIEPEACVEYSGVLQQNKEGSNDTLDHSELENIKKHQDSSNSMFSKGDTCLNDGKMFLNSNQASDINKSSPVQSEKVVPEKDNSKLLPFNPPVSDMGDITAVTSNNLSINPEESSAMLDKINTDENITEPDRISCSFSIKNNSEVSATFNSANAHFNIFDDKTSTNAVFFGMLPDKLKQSFMEYELKHILSMNKLKQSFVNYYFNHADKAFNENESPTCSHEQRPLESQSNCQTNNEDSLVFFLDQNHKSLSNSHQEPKSKVTDENQEKEQVP